mgnify:CR=1 FL=1|tara:strand:+ start:6939 stop:8447 length:1509 start_codon:yes stop_codon:yes gene_type:complete
MKKFSKITESFLVKKIKRLIKEEELEEVVISPQQYYDLLKAVYYKAQAIPRLSRFKGKKIVINGDVKLSQFKEQKFLTDLGSIKVNGDLDITYTGIKSLDNVEVTGDSRYWSTPYDKVMISRRQRVKEQEQEVRREDDEWNLNDTDEEGERANAAFNYGVQEGNLETLNDDERLRIEEIKTEIKELEEQQSNLDSGEDDYDEEWKSIEERIDDLNSEMDSILEDKADVYDMYPTGNHYYLTSFESLSTGQEYAVGTEDEADKSMEDYYGEMLDNPTSYFDNNYLSYYIDDDEVKDYFRDTVEEWIRESPENYDVEKELSRSQEDDIWLLQMEKYIFENTGVRFPIQYQTKEDGNIFDFEDGEGNRFQYYNEGGNWVLDRDGVRVDPNNIYDDEDTSDQQDDKDSRISDIEYEIQEIKDNPDDDPDEDSIEEAVETYLNDEIGDNAYEWLKNYGYGIDNFIDIKRLKENLISNSDYGQALNGYDGQYDEIKVNGTYYIVMRVN